MLITFSYSSGFPPISSLKVWKWNEYSPAYLKQKDRSRGLLLRVANESEATPLQFLEKWISSLLGMKSSDLDQRQHNFSRIFSQIF